MRLRLLAAGLAVAGQVAAERGDRRTLMGAFPRDYAYDLFIVKFPAEARGGAKVLEPADAEAQLVVRIYNKTGTVVWPVASEALR